MLREIQYKIFENYPEINCRTIWLQREGGKPGSVEECIRLTDWPLEQIASAEQVHGNRINLVKEPGSHLDCDGLISDCKGITLSIRTADCAAVMIVDPAKKVVANLHAGWRGIRGKVISKGISQLIQHWNSKPANLLVAISPVIRECCYQVGEEFTDLFPEHHLTYREGNIYFSMESALMEQLRSTGVLKANVSLNPNCTFCSPLMLPSFRRTGTTNRLFNLIRFT